MSKEIIENNKLLIEIRKIVKEEVGTIVKEEVRTIVKEEVNVALKPLTIDVSKISQRLNKVEKSLNISYYSIEKELNDLMKKHLKKIFPEYIIINLKNLKDIYEIDNKYSQITEFDGVFKLKDRIYKNNKKYNELFIIEAKHHTTIDDINKKLLQMNKIMKILKYINNVISSHDDADIFIKNLYKIPTYLDTKKLDKLLEAYNNTYDEKIKKKHIININIEDTYIDDNLIKYLHNINNDTLKSYKSINVPVYDINTKEILYKKTKYDIYKTLNPIKNIKSEILNKLKDLITNYEKYDRLKKLVYDYELTNIKKIYLYIGGPTWGDDALNYLYFLKNKLNNIHGDSVKLNSEFNKIKKGDFIEFFTKENIDLEYIYPSESKYNVIDDNLTIPKPYKKGGGDNKYTYDMINMRNNIKWT